MFVKKEKSKERQGRFVIPLNRMGRTVLVFLLSAAMVFPLLLNGNNSTEASQMQTQEKIIVPEPIKVYDFENGLEEIEKNDKAYSVPDNANKPTVIKDEEKGKVLKLGEPVQVVGDVVTTLSPQGTPTPTPIPTYYPIDMPSVLPDVSAYRENVVEGKKLTIENANGAFVAGTTNEITLVNQTTGVELHNPFVGVEKLKQTVEQATSLEAEPGKVNCWTLTGACLTGPQKYGFADFDRRIWNEYDQETVTYTRPNWTNGITVSFWLKTDANTNHGEPMLTFVGGSQMLVIRQNGSVQFKDGAEQLNMLDLTSTSYLHGTYGEWNYYTITIANDWVQVYVNGQENLYTQIELSRKKIQQFNDGFLTRYNSAGTITEEDVQNDVRKYYVKSGEWFFETQYYWTYMYHDNYSAFGNARYRGANNGSKLIMDVLTDPDTKMYIGGAESAFDITTHSLLEGTQISDVVSFYEELSPEQIAANYAAEERSGKSFDVMTSSVASLNMTAAEEPASEEQPYTVYSELSISNPFAGLDMEEYDELYEMTKGNGGLVLYGDKYCPYWEKGLTMSYWIKVPANEDGTYKNSSTLRWELDDQNYYQVDNLALHLTCKKYDTEIAEYTEEEKAGFNESGVAEDSKYYFTIIEDSYINGEGTEGPVYGTVGEYAFCNKNYRKGFQKTSNGGYEKVYVWKDDAYKYYSTIPTEVSPEEYNEILALGAREAAATIEERNIRRQDFIEGERYMELGKSKVRFAEEDGEFQVDVDNSTFFCPDNIKGIDANINESIYYGQTNGMHNGDVFFMNSWREGSSRENKSGYSYQSSAYQAESPVTKVETKLNEKGKEYLDATKNGNVNTWQHVTITMQNDWIEFYMNGKCVDVRYNYSSRGELCLDQGESFKRFNKGAGLRYGYGSRKQVGSIMFGYYVARLFMDWITDPEAILHIGGTGDYAGDYNCATEGCEFEMDDLTFYGELLDDKQIMAAYQASAKESGMKLSETTAPVPTKEPQEPTVPEPIKVYDFESGLKGVQMDENEDIDPNYRIVMSKEVYLQKKAEEIKEYEYVDANGLVYFGSGDNIRYQKTHISNQPSSMFDEEKGTVLKLGNAVTIPQIIKTKSAAITNDALGTETLDKAIPVSESEVVQPEYTCYSEVTISNPFAGLDMEEYDELFDMTKENGGLVLLGEKYSPKWKKGLTMSYWIKVPSDENGNYKNSSVLRWELNDQNYYQADDYAAHLTCKKYDQEVAAYSEEEKISFNESGVAEDSNFYFTIVEDSYIAGDGTEGPVYGTVGKYAFYNKNYRKGFQKTSNGGYEKVYAMRNEAYKYYSTIPTEVSPEEYNEILATTEAAATLKKRNIRKQDFIEGERYMELGMSKVRFAEEDGEFQVDVDNSTFFCPDNIKGIDANINESVSYGQTNGMHNGDVFFMNSWREGSSRENKSGYSYQSSAYQAESPVTKVETKTSEKGREYEEATKNGNVNTWQHVTITMQNDWIEFYMNGKCVDVRYNYSSRGELCLDKGESFKRFNKGAGLRYGYGSEKQVASIMYGSYVARLFMDWITDPEAILHIGGTGDYAGDYNCATKGCEFAIDDLTFYDELLDENQIMAAYQKSLAKKNETANVSASGASIDLSKATLSADGAAKVGAATIKGNKYTKLEVDENLNSSTNISATLANPFAGKKLEGATIAYWMKQDARTGEKAAQATAGISFMDSPKWVESVKDFGSSSEASSILYMKSNGSMQFQEAFSDKRNSASLKNNFNFTPSETDAADILKNAYDWHFYTMTFTNAGMNLFVDGKKIRNEAGEYTYGIRFLDGYYLRADDEEDITTRYGVFGGTNNQGATTLMDFLTYADTAIHVGQMPVSDDTFEKTNPTSYAGMVSYDTELTAEQVLKLYQVQLEASTTPEPESTIIPTPVAYALGDVDGDGVMSILDGRVALQASLGSCHLEGSAFYAADLNEDGKITQKDADDILYYAVRANNPISFPGPGVQTISKLSADKIDMATPTLTAVVDEDGYYEVTLHVNGNLNVYDYAIVYDSDTISFPIILKDGHMTSNYLPNFEKLYYSEQGIISEVKPVLMPLRGDGQYFLYYGAAGNDISVDTDMVTIKFLKLENASKPGKVAVLKNSAAYDTVDLKTALENGAYSYDLSEAPKKMEQNPAITSVVTPMIKGFSADVLGDITKENTLNYLNMFYGKASATIGKENTAVELAIAWSVSDFLTESGSVNRFTWRLTDAVLEQYDTSGVITGGAVDIANPMTQPTEEPKPIATPTAIPKATPAPTPTTTETSAPKPAKTPVPAMEYKLGDADGNSKVDLTDANTVLKAALGIVTLTGSEREAADADRNGKIDLSDANTVLKAALGIVTL